MKKKTGLGLLLLVIGLLVFFINIGVFFIDPILIISDIVLFLVFALPGGILILQARREPSMKIGEKKRNWKNLGIAFLIMLSLFGLLMIITAITKNGVIFAIGIALLFGIGIIVTPIVESQKESKEGKSDEKKSGYVIEMDRRTFIGIIAMVVIIAIIIIGLVFFT